MSDDPLQPRVDLHPHTVTMNAAARLMKLAQALVTEMDTEHVVECDHMINVRRGEPKIGKYTLVMYTEQKRQQRTFDIQLMLDAREGWRNNLATHVKKMYKDITDAV